VKTVVVVCCIVLAGCALPNFTSPPGKTEQQSKRDAYECERDTMTVTGAGGVIDTSPDRQLYRKCMESLGYKKQ
jgi:hypothetical protein